MDELSHRDHVCLFALDETGIRIESDNFCGWAPRWAPKGLPLYAQANGDHKGVDVIGATEILRSYKPYYSIQPSQKGMKSQHAGEFIDKLETVRIQLTKSCPRGYASFSYAPTTHLAR